MLGGRYDRAQTMHVQTLTLFFISFPIFILFPLFPLPNSHEGLIICYANDMNPPNPQLIGKKGKSYQLGLAKGEVYSEPCEGVFFHQP